MALTDGVDDRPRAAPADRVRQAGAAGTTLLAGAVAFVISYKHGFGLDAPGVVTAFALIGVLATAIVLPARQATIAIVALAVVWVFGYVVYSKVPGWIDSPIPVNDAVGGAAVFMSSYVDYQLAGAVLIGAVLVAGIALALRGGRGGSVGAPSPDAEPASRAHTPGPDPAPGAPSPAAAAVAPAASPHRAWILALGAGALVIVSLLPDLHHVLIDGTRGPLPKGWDAANLIAWDAFHQRGLVPMRDYFYPYGASWLLSDFPTGPAVLWLWRGGQLAAAGWALWRLIGPKPGRIALCLLAMVAIGGLDPVDVLDVPLVWRYMPAFVLAVCYAAVGPLRHRRPTRAHLVFAAVCAAVGSMEADVLVAGLGGAAFVGLGELVFDPALRTWRTIRAALVDVLPVLAGIGCMLLFWVATQSFSQNVAWFTAFRAVSAASAAVESQFGALVGLHADPSQVTVFVLIPALLLAAAFLVRRFGGAIVSASVTSRVLFAAAGCTTIMLEKHLVRPQGRIMVLIPFVALLWTAILQWSPRSMRSLVGAGLVGGVALGMLQGTASVSPTKYLGNAIATPVRAVDDLRLVLNRGEIHAAGDGRFAPQRFDGIPEKTFIADKLAAGLSGTGDSRFATLGDAQILYVLFGQRPPGQITLYDASRRSEQERWIDDVRKFHTRLLIWRRDLYIDGVQYWVRDPLVFSYAVAHYVPQMLSDPMDVLRLRKPGEPVAMSYWAKRIGDVVNLAGIPSYSSGAGLGHCSGGSGCVPYAIVSGPGDTTGKQVTVKLAGTPYGVLLAERKGVTHYAIRLDRLWFWPYVKSTALTTSDPAFTVKLVDVNAGSDLY